MKASLLQRAAAQRGTPWAAKRNRMPRSICLIGLLFVVLVLLACAFEAPQGLDRVSAYLKSVESSCSVQPGQGRFLYALDSKTRPTQLVKRKLLWSKHGAIRPQTVEFYAYTYADSLHCMDAFETLLSCFPMDCFTLSRNRSFESYKIVPCLLIADGTTIVAATVSCSDTTGWTGVKSEVSRAFYSPDAIVIEAECGGPLWWPTP